MGFLVSITEHTELSDDEDDVDEDDIDVDEISWIGVEGVFLDEFSTIVTDFLQTGLIHGFPTDLGSFNLFNASLPRFKAILRFFSFCSSITRCFSFSC